MLRRQALARVAGLEHQRAALELEQRPQDHGHAHPLEELGKRRRPTVRDLVDVGRRGQDQRTVREERVEQMNCALPDRDPETVPPWNLPEAELQKRIGPGEVGFAIGGTS